MHQTMIETGWYLYSRSSCHLGCLSSVEVPVQVLATLLVIQLPADASQEAADDEANMWVPEARVGALD